MNDAQTFVADLSDTWEIGSKLKLPAATINANEYAVGVYGAHPHPLGAVWEFPDKSLGVISMIVTELQMIEKRRQFLAMHGLTIQSAFDLSLKEKKKLSGEFIEWLRKIGVTNGDDPHWSTTPIGAAAR